VKAKKLLMVFLIGIFALPLISSTKKDPCQAADDLRFGPEIFKKLKRPQNDDYDYDHCFFRNSSGDQIILVEEGCECSAGKLDANIFYKNNIPEDVLEHYRIESSGTPLNKKLKHAILIDNKYFTTKKGIKLGMGIDEVIKVYGKPEKTTVLKKSPKIIVKYMWEVPGKYELEDSEQPIANDQPEISTGKTNEDTKELHTDQNTTSNPDTDQEKKNETSNKPESKQSKGVDTGKVIEQILKNPPKTGEDRIYENDFGSKDVYSPNPPPMLSLPEKKYPKSKICKYIEIGVTIEITFINGKAALIWIGPWGV